MLDHTVVLLLNVLRRFCDFFHHGYADLPYQQQCSRAPFARWHCLLSGNSHFNRTMCIPLRFWSVFVWLLTYITSSYVYSSCVGFFWDVTVQTFLKQTFFSASKLWAIYLVIYYLLHTWLSSILQVAFSLYYFLYYAEVFQLDVIPFLLFFWYLHLNYHI